MTEENARPEPAAPEEAPKAPAPLFKTDKGDDGETYIPVSRIIEPDGQDAGKAWAGYPVPLRDAGPLPVAACALAASASKAGAARAEAVSEASRKIEELRGAKPFPLGEVLRQAEVIARQAFAHYSDATLENELLPRVDVRVAGVIAASVLGSPPSVRVAKTQAPASSHTSADAGAS